MQLAGISVDGVRRGKIYRAIEALEYAHSQTVSADQALHLIQRALYALTKLVYAGIDLSWLRDALQ